MAHRTRFTPRPLALTALVVPVLLQACGGGGGGGGGGESRADITASIPEQCRFLAGEAFGLSDEELRDVRDAGCLLPPTGDTTMLPPEDDVAVDATPDTEEGGVATAPPVTTVGMPSADGDAGPGDVDGSSFLITGNNSARLTGADFGRGRDANATLRRSVPVRLATPSADFEIEAAHVVGTGEFFDIVVVVTNRANATLCDIDLGVWGIVDRAGTVFTDEDRSFGVSVEGSAARPPTGRLDTRCLAPGETSYGTLFSTPDGLEADDVTAVAVPGITADDTPFESAMSRIVPTGYTVERGLDVTVRNDGLIDVELGYGLLIVLDEGGYPLEVTNYLSDRIVPAGGEAVVSFDGVSVFAGRADTVRVIVGYDDIR